MIDRYKFNRGEWGRVNYKDKVLIINQYLHNSYKWRKIWWLHFADLTDRTMMINMKCCICLALTTTQQKTNKNSTVSLMVFKPALHWKCIHSHEVNLHSSVTLILYRVWLIYFSHRGGHWSKHSHCQTWLLAE